jgi:hypothetical protein
MRRPWKAEVGGSKVRVLLELPTDNPPRYRGYANRTQHSPFPRVSEQSYPHHSGLGGGLRFAKALRPGDRQHFDDFGFAWTAYITIEHVNLQLCSGRMRRDDGKGRCPMTNGAQVPELILE